MISPYLSPPTPTLQFDYNSTHTILLSRCNSCCGAVCRGHTMSQGSVVNECLYVRQQARHSQGEAGTAVGGGRCQKWKSFTHVCLLAGDKPESICPPFTCRYFDVNLSMRAFSRTQVSPPPPTTAAVGEDCFTPIFQLMEPDIWSQTMIWPSVCRGLFPSGDAYIACLTFVFQTSILYGDTSPGIKP